MKLIEDALDARWPIVLLARRDFLMALGNFDVYYLGRRW